MSQLEEEVTIRDRQIESHLKKISTLEKMLKNFKEFGNELNDLRQQAKEKNQEIEDMELEIEDFAGRIKEERKFIEEEHVKVLRNLSKTTEDLLKTKKELENFTKNFENLETENDELRAKLSNIGEGFMKKQQESDISNKVGREELNKQLELLQGACKSEQKRVQQLEEEKRHQDIELTKTVGAIEKRDEKISLLEKEWTEKIAREREDKERIYNDLKNTRDEAR